MVAGQVPDDSSRHDLDALWRATQDRLRASVPESTYRLWLEPLRGGRRRRRHPLPDRPGGHPGLGRAPLLVADRRSARRVRHAAARRSASPRRSEAGGRRPRPSVELNPNYTFDRFVIGAGNRLAHGAALAVAEAPSEAYNPLFLHGPPGLGKTHLLAAIANYLRRQRSRPQRPLHDRRVLHQRVRRAPCKSAGAEAFKARYRDIDVLLIDDVQFLEGKPAHRGGVLPHLQRPLRVRQPAGPLRRPHPQRALDPRLAPARPLRVGPDRRRSSRPTWRPG